MDASSEEEAVEAEAAAAREDFTRSLLRFLPEFRRTEEGIIRLLNPEPLAVEVIFVEAVVTR